MGPFLSETMGTQKPAATGRDKINMSFTAHASLLGLQKDNKLMTNMCHGDLLLELFLN